MNNEIHIDQTVELKISSSVLLLNKETLVSTECQRFRDVVVVCAGARIIVLTLGQPRGAGWKTVITVC